MTLSRYGDWEVVSSVYRARCPGENHFRDVVDVRCVAGYCDSEVTTRRLSSLLTEHTKRCKKCRYVLARGELSAHYKADALYPAMHARVKKIRGKAVSCIWGCISNNYEWANLTGNYQDIEDYAAMCRKCHSKFDASIYQVLVQTSTDELIRTSGIRWQQKERYGTL